MSVTGLKLNAILFIANTTPVCPYFNAILQCIESTMLRYATIMQQLVSMV